MSSPVREDFRAACEIICTILGIGALGLAFSFSAAGPIYGSLGLVLVCIINVYATILLSRCLANAPSHVQTYSDLGFHVFGEMGRSMVIFSQFSTCLLVPIGFLILGGKTLLPGIFSGAWEPSTEVWIIVMALALLPVLLVPSLKEAPWCVLLGAATAAGSALIAVGDSLITKDMYEGATVVKPLNVFGVFGGLTLAYGTAIVLPGIQREHSDVTRMPRVIVLSMVLVTVIYFLIAGLGYYQYGCHSPENLLLAMSDGPALRMAYGLMQLHVMVALVVILGPACFLFERQLFGFNKQQRASEQSLKAPDLIPISAKKSDPLRHSDANMSEDDLLDIPRRNVLSCTGSVGELVAEVDEGGVRGFRDTLKSWTLRTSVLLIQAFIAIVLQDSFYDFVALIGASTITLVATVLPAFFFLKMFYNQHLPKWQVILCGLIIFISLVLGAYSSAKSVEKIIANAQNYRFFQPAMQTPPKDYTKEFCEDR